MEHVLELIHADGMLLFGLAFFTFTIANVHKSHDKDYERTLNERREFGFEDPKVRSKRLRNFRTSQK